MRNTITIPTGDWDVVRRHLLQNDVEQAAVVYAAADTVDDEVRFMANDFELLQPDDFDFQSAYHISLTDTARGRIIKRAWDSRSAMIELHSHVGSFASAEFSPSDLHGFQDFVPHVRWRLRGVPYAALVVADDAFDALIWTSERPQGDALDALLIGNMKLKPTGYTIRRREAYHG